MLAGDPEGGGDGHKNGRCPEHPARRGVVHDPTEQQGPDNTADIEAGGNDAESPPNHAGWRRLAHQHVARGMMIPDKKPARPSPPMIREVGRVSVAMPATMTVVRPKPTAAT